MTKGLVTVVLSIYNVAPYLNRCIESVVGQTYQNLEILLIDDGSPDNCPAICDEWAQKDSRIRVIHKQNAGLGMARNTGIENATGEYICFFDSDDYIAPETIEKAYTLAEKEESDVVVFGYHGVDNQNNVKYSFAPNHPKKVFTGTEVLEEFFPDFMAPNPHKKEPRRFYMSAWVLLYSTELVHECGWKFVSERQIIAEDVYSMLTLFPYVNKVAVLSEALYYYCDNGASLSRGYRPDRYEKIKHFYGECMKVCKEMNYSEEICHRVSKPFVSFTLGAMKQECAVKSSFKEAKKAVATIGSDAMLQGVLEQNKHDVVGFGRKIMFFVLRRKWFGIATLLFKFKG